MRFLTEAHGNLLEKPEEFKPQFEWYFENSGRNFTYVSFGYEVALRFPAGELRRIDAGSDLEAGRDKAAEWVVSALEALKAEIEVPGRVSKIRVLSVAYQS